MRTVEFSEKDVCRSIENNFTEKFRCTLRSAGYEIYHAGNWEWDEDGYVDRNVVIRHAETGVLFKGFLNLPLVARNECMADGQVVFREVRETKIEVPHFEYV